MKFGKTKRIFVSVLAALLALMMLFTSLVAYAAEDLPSHYIIDNTNTISRYDIDLIDSVGKELESHGIKLITVVERELRNGNANSIIKDQYFKWFGQLNNNNEKHKKLVVVNYYLEDNKLIVFDDKENYISSPTLLKLQGDMELYIKNQDIESGMYYLYSVVADKIADDADVSLESSNSTLKYEKDTWLKSMPALFGSLIVIVLVFSFRRKKD